MKTSELKNKIASSYENATPDVLDRVKFACANSVQQDAMPDMDGEFNSKRSYSYITRYVAVFAAVVIVFFLGLAVGRINRITPVTDSATEVVTTEAVTTEVSLNTPITAPDNVNGSGGPGGEIIAPPKVGGPIATIFIDVNPSIEMTVDVEFKVVTCKANNEDAQRILNGMELEGVQCHTALNAIVGSMYMNGYLQGDTKAMLLSVDTEVDGVLEEIAEDVNGIFVHNDLTCDLISISVDVETVIDLATANGISAGKMEFIEQIIEESDSLTEDDASELAKLSISTLKELFDNINETIEDVLNNSAEIASEAAEGAAELASTAVSDTDKLVTDVTEDTDKLVDDTLKDTDKLVDDTLKDTDKLVDDVVEDSSELVDDVLSDVDKLIEDILNNDGNIVEDVSKDVQDLVDHAVENSGELASAAAENANNLANNATDNANELASNAAENAEELASNAAENAQSLANDVVEQASMTAEEILHSVTELLKIWWN